MKRRIIFILIVFLTIISCSKKKETPLGSVNLPAENNNSVNKVSIFYPLGDESRKNLSEDQILEKYKTILVRIFPETQKGKFRGTDKKSFSRYVYSRIDEDPVVQQTILELQKNGVYFLVGGTNSAPVKVTRYKGADHISLYKNGILKMMELFLKQADESLDNLDLALGGHINGRYNFPVDEEDEVDPVFHLDGEMTFYAIPDVFLDKFKSDIQEGLITLPHFWNPDAGWNGGNYNVWLLIKAKLEEALGGNSVGNAMGIIRPEYFAALLKEPPSAFYKALCLWYGWREIEWREDERIWGDSHQKQEDSIHPGVIDLLKNGNKTLAVNYFAHLVHLLQDMSVPVHVHNWPHGGNLGGDDLWEKRVLPSIREIFANESYRFTAQDIADQKPLTYYTAKNPDLLNEMDDNGNFKPEFLRKIQAYYQMFSNTFGLWPLFFNTAQATQFFPAITTWNVLIKGNDVPAVDCASYLLSAQPEFTGTVYQSYGDETQFDMDYINASMPKEDQPLRVGGKEKPVKNTAVYFLVYNNNGAETESPESGVKIEFTIKDLIAELKAVGVTEINDAKDLVVMNNGKIQIRQIQDQSLWGKKIYRDFGIGEVVITLIDTDGYVFGEIFRNGIVQGKPLQIYYIGYPFNKMVEHLLPLTIATTTRLVRNYYRYYY